MSNEAGGRIAWVVSVLVALFTVVGVVSDVTGLTLVGVSVAVVGLVGLAATGARARSRGKTSSRGMTALPSWVKCSRVRSDVSPPEGAVTQVGDGAGGRWRECLCRNRQPLPGPRKRHVSAGR